MKETAVKWFALKVMDLKLSPKEMYDFLDWYDKAKEMEEKQTVNFANDFYDDCVTEGGSLNQSAEEYYKQKYKQ
jgi:hypothetical protein